MLRITLCLALAAAAVFAAEPVSVDVYRSGEGGYHTYRIPALIVSTKGTLLAFCEGRRNSSSDTGDIDLLLRRSFDNGKTWQPVQKLADFDEDVIGNPAPVIERKSGAIFLLLTSNPGKINEAQILKGVAPRGRTVWVMHSKDDGVTWTKPEDITSTTKREDWTWYATGPGNGIQLASGRMVIACDHNRKEGGRYSHLIYSDDRGKSWKLGALADLHTNESAVAELKSGALQLNMRSYHGKNRRAVQESSDGGLTLGPLRMDEALIEPVCQASLITTTGMGRKGNGRLLFSNPAAKTRTRMTVRMSEDDGRTWKHERVIQEGPAAYSSLAILKDRSVGMLYEHGEKSAYERITFIHFGLDWLKSK